jgi:hypothetical protein
MMSQLRCFHFLFAAAFESTGSAFMVKLKCLRTDEIFTSKSIVEEIWNGIKISRFIIADLTDRNPNVFYFLKVQ